MDSLDDIFGGLAGSLPHIGDPDRQHIPSIPFLCAEDVIEHHEHGSNMSPNTGAEKYLLAFGRGKVEANATAAGCLFATAGRIFSEQIFSEQQKYRVQFL